MQRPVSAHIEELKWLVHQLNDELMHEDDLAVRNHLEARIRAAQLALRHYQAALELEQKLAQNH